MTFYITYPNFDVLSVIINFLLVKNHRENILKRTIQMFDFCTFHDIDTKRILAKIKWIVKWIKCKIPWLVKHLRFHGKLFIQAYKDISTMHLKFDPTKVRTHDLSITESIFHVPETLVLTTELSRTSVWLHMSYEYARSKCIHHV